MDDPHFAARGDGAKRALENAQKLVPNSPETLLALGYYQYWVLRDYGPGGITFERVSKMLPGSSEAPYGSRLSYPTPGRAGMKALPTSSKPSPWTHVMWS